LLLLEALGQSGVAMTATELGTRSDLPSKPRTGFARRAFVMGIDLSHQTEFTHTEPEALTEDLARIAKRGYALDEEEFIDNMVAIAVPVHDPSGRFTAALAYHGSKTRMSLDDAIERRTILTDGAQCLSGFCFRMRRTCPSPS